MEVMYLVLFVIVLVCFYILMFGTRCYKGWWGYKIPSQYTNERIQKINVL